MTKINRAYSHKTFGDIGSAELTVEAVGKGKLEATLNGVTLPEQSVTYLLTFALQSLQDAYAGAKNAAEAAANFGKKLKAVQEGTIGSRGTGDGASAFQRVARSVVRSLLQSKGGENWTKFKAIEDEDEQNAKLDAIFAKNEAALKPQVDAEIERRARVAAEKKALQANIGVELDL